MDDVQDISMLKRTCEQCTKSKVRCSGPENGVCERCLLRKTECVFRTKMKRGPQAAADDEQKKSRSIVAAESQPQTRKKTRSSAESASRTGEADSDAALHPQGISWHERRCWNVFFSTFKHQNRRENPTSWCWFALQIDRLKKELEKNRNTAALQRLEAWMDSAHTKMYSLEEQTSQVCTFAPHLCGGCSSNALANYSRSPSPRSDAGQDSSASTFFCDPGHERLPYIEFEMDSNGAEILHMNTAFTSQFRHTKESLERTLSWSKGGFLPWGGDLVSRLLWSEADVLVFLQVLAVKFQAIGPPKHDHDDPEKIYTREVLSAYIFDVRVANEDEQHVNAFQEKIMPCMVKAIHRETLQGLDLRITVLLEFEMVGGIMDGPETPESAKEALSASLQRLPTNVSAQKVEKQDSFSATHSKSKHILPTPQTDAALVDGFDWVPFESMFANESGRVELPTADESADFLKSDEDWLSSLLEWTV